MSYNTVRVTVTATNTWMSIVTLPLIIALSTKLSTMITAVQEKNQVPVLPAVLPLLPVLVMAPKKLLIITLNIIHSGPETVLGTMDLTVDLS